MHAAPVSCGGVFNTLIGLQASKDLELGISICMSMLSTYSSEGTSDTHILFALVFLPEMAYRDAMTDMRWHRSWCARL